MTWIICRGKGAALDTVVGGCIHARTIQGCVGACTIQGGVVVLERTMSCSLIFGRFGTREVRCSRQRTKGPVLGDERTLNHY